MISGGMEVNKLAQIQFILESNLETITQRG